MWWSTWMSCTHWKHFTMMIGKMWAFQHVNYIACNVLTVLTCHFQPCLLTCPAHSIVKLFHHLPAQLPLGTYSSAVYPSYSSDCPTGLSTLAVGFCLIISSCLLRQAKHKRQICPLCFVCLLSLFGPSLSAVSLTDLWAKALSCTGFIGRQSVCGSKFCCNL